MDKKNLNNKIDEFLVMQEMKLAEITNQNKLNYESDLKQKNYIADKFKKRFLNNLLDPNYNLEEEDTSAKDLDLMEKSSFLRIQNTVSQEYVEANYNTFKIFKDSLEDREKDRSNISTNNDYEKKKDFNEKNEFLIVGSPKFQNFSNFINNNDTKTILNVIKDNSSVGKNTNFFERGKNTNLGK